MNASGVIDPKILANMPQLSGSGHSPGGPQSYGPGPGGLGGGPKPISIR